MKRQQRLQEHIVQMVFRFNQYVWLTQEVDASGKLASVYHTGLAVEIPEGHMGLIFMRSSVAGKSLVLTNAVGGGVNHLYLGEITMKFKVTTDSIPTVYHSMLYWSTNSSSLPTI